MFYYRQVAAARGATLLSLAEGALPIQMSGMWTGVLPSSKVYCAVIDPFWFQAAFGAADEDSSIGIGRLRPC